MKLSLIYKISSFVLVCMFCLLALAGCANGIELPNTNAGVTGNGGLAVQKGEYLYFVNGYTAVSDMKDGDNKTEDISYWCIKPKIGVGYRF